MMSTFRTIASSTAMRDAIERYQKRGYEVLVEPDPNDLPRFLEGFRPDMLAFSPDGSGGVVVEVSTGVGARKESYLSALAERIKGQPNWKLEVIGVEAERPHESADVASTDDLDAQLAQARELIRADREQAGFLLLWSMIEGALRAYVDKRKLPVSSRNPLEIFKLLVTQGLVDREEYDHFRDAFELRSRWAHGLRAPTRGAEPVISDTLEIADDLMKKVRADARDARPS